MKLLRKPWVNALVIGAVSAFYGLVFIFTAKNPVFGKMLGYDPVRQIGSLQSPFWNGWSTFLYYGNHRYIGYAFLVLGAVIVLLTLIRRREYDEYQTGILEKCLILSAVASFFGIPFLLLSVLEDLCYTVDFAILLSSVYWTLVLLADLLFTLLPGREIMLKTKGRSK